MYRRKSTPSVFARFRPKISDGEGRRIDPRYELVRIYIPVGQILSLKSNGNGSSRRWGEGAERKETSPCVVASNISDRQRHGPDRAPHTFNIRANTRRALAAGRNNNRVYENVTTREETTKIKFRGYSIESAAVRTNGCRVTTRDTRGFRDRWKILDEIGSLGSFLSFLSLFLSVSLPLALSFPDFPPVDNFAVSLLRQGNGRKSNYTNYTDRCVVYKHNVRPCYILALVCTHLQLNEDI